MTEDDLKNYVEALSPTPIPGQKKSKGLDLAGFDRLVDDLVSAVTYY
jgi:hypothetical protein